MEGNGISSTIPRPPLPALPPETRAVRGIADPYAGHVPVTPVVDPSPPAAELSASGATAVGAAALKGDGTGQRIAFTDIARPPLPPTPPPLTPLTPEAIAEAAAARAAAAQAAAVAAAPADAPITDLFPTVSTKRSSLPDAPSKTKSDIASKQNPAKVEMPAAVRAHQQKLDEQAKKSKKVDKKRQKKAARSGTSNIFPLIGAAIALAIIGVAIYFGSQLIGNTTVVAELQTGECVQNYFDSSEDGTFVEIFAVRTVDCAEPHAYEVFAVEDALFPGEDYPGIEASFALGQSFCLTEYETFIGGGAENLDTWAVWTFVPPEDSWSGDRVVQCLVGEFDQQNLITGTLEGIAAG